MRMLRNTPAVGAGVKPNCEALGYLLDRNGNCSYIQAYHEATSKATTTRISVREKTCLCTHMRNFRCWTCGHYVYKLKDTTNRLKDGSYQILTAKHVFEDYQFSVDHEIKLPPKPEEN